MGLVEWFLGFYGVFGVFLVMIVSSFVLCLVVVLWMWLSLLWF